MADREPNLPETNLSEPGLGESQPLHIPEGINYECTGCGRCCSGWAVPMTAADYERISAVDWGSLHKKLNGADLFRELKDHEKEGSPYTHAIKPDEEGLCPFLVNNLCFIHSSFESKTKPSICQLFPYNFNETPSGFYSTVSFVSVGAVLNAGKPLTEQRDYLNQKFAEFKKMYPDHHPNWSKIELCKEVPLTWERYLEIEAELLRILQNDSESLEMRLAHMSLFVVGEYLKGRGSDIPEAQLKIELGPKHQLKPIEHVLLKELYRLYFPEKTLNRAESNFSASKFMQSSMAAKMGIAPQLKLRAGDKSFNLADVKAVTLPDVPELKDIFYRFIYQRIFGKLYFGAGFGQLSLMVGLHHLITAYSLWVLQCKATALGRGVFIVAPEDIVNTGRMLEKRLGDMTFDGYAAGALEMELQSHGRVLRFLSMCL